MEIKAEGIITKEDFGVAQKHIIKSAKKAKREVNYLSGKVMKNLIQTSLDIADPKIKKIFIDAIKGDI